MQATFETLKKFEPGVLLKIARSNTPQLVEAVGVGDLESGAVSMDWRWFYERDSEETSELFSILQSIDELASVKGQAIVDELLRLKQAEDFELRSLSDPRKRIARLAVEHPNIFRTAVMQLRAAELRSNKATCRFEAPSLRIETPNPPQKTLRRLRERLANILVNGPANRRMLVDLSTAGSGKRAAMRRLGSRHLPFRESRLAHGPSPR